jgi:cobalt-zinc-cadmium efflux system outer membrane protein
MKHFGFAAAFLLFVTGTAHADVPGLPPDAEAERALDNYPGVTAAQARIGSARAQADMLRAGPNEFVLSGAFSRRTVEREGLYSEVDATLSRIVRLPGKAGLDRKAGALGVEVAKNHSEDVRHHAALLLSQLWYDWLQAGEFRRNDARTVEMQESALASVQKRADVRDAALLEVDQARAALAIAQAQLAETNAKLESARVTLAATFPEVTLAAAPPVLPPPSLGSFDASTLRDLVVERSHEIRAADGDAERLLVLANRARQDRIPDPTVGMRVFRERGGLERGVGVTLSIPLGWEHRRASAARAAAEASAAGFDTAEVRRQVKAIADSDASEAQNRIAAWESTRASARSADEAEARTRRGHQLGGIDLADLLFTQKQANDVRRAEIAAKVEAARAVTKLLIDSHTIWAEVHEDGQG